jgi:hypothetical protein
MNEMIRVFNMPEQLLAMIFSGNRREKETPIHKYARAEVGVGALGAEDGNDEQGKTGGFPASKTSRSVRHQIMRAHPVDRQSMLLALPAPFNHRESDGWKLATGFCGKTAVTIDRSTHDDRRARRQWVAAGKANPVLAEIVQPGFDVTGTALGMQQR